MKGGHLDALLGLVTDKGPWAQHRLVLPSEYL